MNITKSAVLAITVLAVASSPALAGGQAEPIMEPEVIAAESVGTAGGFVVPLILLAIIAAVAAGSGGSSGGMPIPAAPVAPVAPPIFN